MKRRAPLHGMSLIEVMLASSLMLMILLAFYAVAESLQRSQMTSDARIESRQALRSAIRSFSLKGTEASYFYSAAKKGDSVTLGGIVCQLPYESSGTPGAGNSIVVASPRDETRPVDPADDPESPSTALAANGEPDGFCDNKYDILALATRPTVPDDSRNPGSRQLLLMEWDKQAPVSFLAPGTINLAKLGKPPRLKVFNTHLKPLNQGGFRVTYGYKGSTPASATIHAEFHYKPLQGPVQSESYDFIISTRNIF